MPLAMERLHLKKLRVLCKELKILLDTQESWDAGAYSQSAAAFWMRRILTLRCVQARTLPQPHLPEPKSSPLQAVLERCLDVIESPDLDDIFRKPDALSWAHQLWNEGIRQELFKRVLDQASEKIEGEDHIRATTLYTPRPIARFLVQNSLGALWQSSHPNSPPPESWELFVRKPAHPRRPAVSLREVTILDPGCGGGNLLLEAFEMLYELYHLEGDTSCAEEICSAILKGNLFGIDLDREALEVAQTVLWMRAAELAPAIGPINANLACLDLGFDPDEETPILLRHLSLAQPEQAMVEAFLNMLSRLAVVGSLVSESELEAHKNLMGQLWFGELESYLVERIGPEYESTLLGLKWLQRQHDIVIANPPFLSNRQMGAKLKDYVQDRYGDTAEDIYTCFIRRMEQLTSPLGFYAFVSPQGWTTLKSFASFRKRWLGENTLRCLVSLGQRTFDEAPLLYIGLAAIQKTPPAVDSEVTGIKLDGQDRRRIWERLQEICRGGENFSIKQDFLTKIPMTPVTPFVPGKLLELLVETQLRIGDRADVIAGIDSGENARFVRYRWEVSKITSDRFQRYSKGKGFKRWAAPNPWMIDWGRDGERVRAHPGSTIRNASYHFRPGLECSYVYGGKVSCRHLEPSILDHGSIGIFGSTPEDELVILALLNSRIGTFIGRTLSPTLNLSVGCVKRFPFPSPTSTSQQARLIELSSACSTLKRWCAEDETSDLAGMLDHAAIAAVMHTLEGALEVLVADIFGLDTAALEVIFSETGAPISFNPALTNAVCIPTLPRGASNHDLSRPWKLAQMVARELEVTDECDHDLEAAKQNLEELLAQSSSLLRAPRKRLHANGGSRPLPSDSFIEHASTATGLHPLTTYWLLNDGLTRSNWRSAVLERTEMSHRLQQVILRMFDRALPDPDCPFLFEGGIVLWCWPEYRPYIPGLEDDSQQFDATFGVPQEHWIEESFFAAHVEEYAKRPVAWELRSSPLDQGARPLVICLIDGRSISSTTLPELCEKVIGPLRAKLGRLAQQGAENSDAVQGRIQELSSFEDTIMEVIHQGFDTEILHEALESEPLDSYTSADGIEGPPKDLQSFARQERAFAPVPQDGVRINIAPLQRSRLLTAPVLKVGDVEKAIADRARYRADERRWCREGLIAAPSWWSE